MNWSSSDVQSFADVFVGREAAERLEPAGEVIGGDEVGEVLPQLVVALVVEAFDGRLGMG